MTYFAMPRSWEAQTAMITRVSRLNYGPDPATNENLSPK